MERAADVALRCLSAVTASAALNLVAGRFGARATGAGRTAAGVVAASTLAIPFFVEAPPIGVLLVTHIVALHALRTVEIMNRPRAFGPRERIARVILPFETSLMKRVPQRAMIGAVATSLPTLVVGVAALFLAARLAPPTTPYDPHGWPRWLTAAFGAYLVFDGSAALTTALLAAVGWEHPPLHRSPIRAATLAEFWGSRWNLIVSYGLRVNVFMPLARRRAGRLGLFASFGASALLHLYFFVPAVGLTPSLWLGGFFVAQGLLVLVESRLGVRRLRPVFGHAFVVASFAVTIPLFAEPALRGIGL